MTAYLVLVAALFYYVGKGLAPNLFAGHALYPLLAGLTSLFFVYQIIGRRQLISKTVILTFIFVLFSSAFLYAYCYSVNDMRRFETNMSQYFGVFVFFFFFYVIFYSSLKFDPAKAVKILLIILSVASIAEFVAINVFKNTDFLVHYDKGDLAGIRATLGSAIHKASGLLGNRSNTAVFLVALLLLYAAFNGQPNVSKGIFFVFLFGFLSSLSGAGFLVFFLFYMLLCHRRTLWLGLALIPLCFLFHMSTPYFGKLSAEYFALMVWQKSADLVALFQSLENPVFVMFFGRDSGTAIATQNVAGLVEGILNFGIAPVMLNFYLIAKLISNFRRARITPYRHPFLVGAMASLVVGSLHYAVLFSVSVQALIGALAAYSLHARTKARAVSGILSSGRFALASQGDL